MSKVKSFIKEVVARVAGDNAEVTAQKNYRKASSAIQSQIAALKAKEVDDEAALDTENENLENAKFPVTLITDNRSYTSNIKMCYDRVQQATKNLNDTRESIYFFENLLKQYDAEV